MSKPKAVRLIRDPDDIKEDIKRKKGDKKIAVVALIISMLSIICSGIQVTLQIIQTNIRNEEVQKTNKATRPRFLVSREENPDFDALENIVVTNKGGKIRELDVEIEEYLYFIKLSDSDYVEEYLSPLKMYGITLGKLDIDTDGQSFTYTGPGSYVASKNITKGIMPYFYEKYASIVSCTLLTVYKIAYTDQFGDVVTGIYSEKDSKYLNPITITPFDSQLVEIDIASFIFEEVESIDTKLIDEINSKKWRHVHFKDSYMAQAMVNIDDLSETRLSFVPGNQIMLNDLPRVWFRVLSGILELGEEKNISIPIDDLLIN